MKIEPIQVELVDSMGSDVNVVNAARVSFAKSVTEFNLETDLKLIQYLVKHNHWSPLAHTAITVRCKVPIFLARQLVKHQVGGVWNEESRRYITDEPSFYIPEVLHAAPDNAKQGSGAVLESALNADLKSELNLHCAGALMLYRLALKAGVAPEEARMFLPLNTNTNFVWTGSLMFFARVISQRMDSHAQLAAQEFAGKLLHAIEDVYPVTTKVLMEAYNVRQ